MVSVKKKVIILVRKLLRIKVSNFGVFNYFFIFINLQ